MLQRIAVVSAGPLANFLLAIVVYWLLFVAGAVACAGDRAVKPDSLAAVAGLVAGQEIVAVDGGETPTWQALRRLLDRIGDTGSCVSPRSSPIRTRFTTELSHSISGWPAVRSPI